MRYLLAIVSLLGLTSASTCLETASKPRTIEQKQTAGLQKAYFASGCFWCVEAVFESVEGVGEVISGYAGGTRKNPTYEQVSGGATSHAEAVEVYYDSTKVSYQTLLTVFFDSHNPTTLNRQGPDAGPQYRSAIFYQNQRERSQIEQFIKDLEERKAFSGEITTEVSPLTQFWEAEDYHQDYEAKHPNNPYIRAVSIPRLKRFQAKHPELLKDSSH
ncbi:MAG: peptide-methionine (S)-S-oxide reductase MsrA [Saprospiraceae bacterium]|nr:peptide-methionine (S)-S-oxide reductase MsrA [Saprospiraceae bacterium]